MAQPGVIYSSSPVIPTCVKHFAPFSVNNLLLDSVAFIPDFHLVLSFTPQAKGVNSDKLKDVNCNG
jgi:hypothetical protein